MQCSTDKQVFDPSTPSMRKVDDREKKQAEAEVVPSSSSVKIKLS